MITLVIHQNATKYFKNERKLKVEVRDYYSLMSFLVNSFPKFTEFVKQSKNNLTTDFFILNEDKKRVELADVQANKKLKDEVYYLVPSIVGGGRGGIMIAIGIAIIGVAVIASGGLAAGGLAGFGKAMGATAFTVGGMAVSFTQIAMFGASLALQGIMAIVQSQPGGKTNSRSFTDDGSSTENNLFTGLTNTVNSNIPIGIRYGMTRIGGHLVTGYIKTFNHSKSDVITVSENFAA